MGIEKRMQFEAWAASFDLDLKPGRCTMGEPEYSDRDTDFAWQAWLTQEKSIEALRERIAELEQENAALRAELNRAAGPH